MRNSARNRGFIPNYGERYRNGERINTGFVESAVNQVISNRFVKKQQMRWTPRGAHLLLQTRTKVLNGDLEGTFRRWYPAFRSKTEAKAAGPGCPRNFTLSIRGHERKVILAEAVGIVKIPSPVLMPRPNGVRTTTTGHFDTKVGLLEARQRLR